MSVALGEPVRLETVPAQPAPGDGPARAAGRRARFLFFTNECVGLGHLQRCLTLATAVCTADPTATALIVTGAQYVPHGLPAGVDILKLPAMGRDTAGSYAARSLGVDGPHLSRVRAGVASAIARDFDPDVVVVDKLPLGVDSELESTLREVRAGHARVVLGLRDIEDSPEAVRRRWDEGRHGEVLETLYDQVLVYGPESSPDMLITSTRLEWTFVRPGMFASNALHWWAPAIRAGDPVRWPYGAARTAPVDERDVAAVAALSLWQKGHAGGDYVLTGPEPLSQAEQVAIIGEVLRQEIPFEEVSAEEFRRVTRGSWPAPVVDMLLAAWSATIGTPALVTSTVRDVLGVPPRSFREWVTDNQDAFARTSSGNDA